MVNYLSPYTNVKGNLCKSRPSNDSAVYDREMIEFFYASAVIDRRYRTFAEISKGVVGFFTEIRMCFNFCFRLPTLY
jgi:hypothetical protein